MNCKRWMAAGLMLAATGSWAVTLSVSPASPTPVDTLVLEVTSEQPCAFIIPGTVEMTASQVISIRYETGIGVFCVAAVPQPQKVAVGRLPAGTYIIQLVPVLSTPPGAVASTTVTVRNPVPSGDMGPLDDYSGHYVAEGRNEGVFVTQFGRTAFISYLYYGADGNPEWAVMPDARWEPGMNGAASFAGTVWRVESGTTGVVTGTGILTSFQILGQGRFSPTGTFDRARFDINLPQPVTRNLTRFRF